MYPPFKPNQKSIVTSDIEPIYEYLNSLRFHGDGVNIEVDHSPAGITIKLVSNEATVAATGSGGGGNLVEVEIISGENGAYKGFEIDPTTGERTENEVDIFATRTTAYDLSESKNAVGFVVATTTMA